MAVMPLVPETRMVDISKHIRLGNLLVRKVTWLVLTTTSATLISSRDFEADCVTKIAYIYSRLSRTHSFPFRLTETTHSLHFDSQRQHTHSLSLTFDFQQSAPWNVFSLQLFSSLFYLKAILVMQLTPKSRDKIKVADVVLSINHVTFLNNRFPRLISLPTSIIFVLGTSGITAILNHRSVNPICVFN